MRCTKIRFLFAAGWSDSACLTPSISSFTAPSADWIAVREGNTERGVTVDFTGRVQIDTDITRRDTSLGCACGGSGSSSSGTTADFRFCNGAAGVTNFNDEFCRVGGEWRECLVLRGVIDREGAGVLLSDPASFSPPSSSGTPFVCEAARAGLDGLGRTGLERTGGRWMSRMMAERPMTKSAAEKFS